MAILANHPVDLSGLLTVDCGATTTLKASLNNITDARPKNVAIQLAMAGVTIKSSHVGTKTYDVHDRTGTSRPISTQAYNVKELNQELLAGRGLTDADYRVVLDKHDLQSQGYFQSATMELLMRQTVSHLLVCTWEACSMFEQKN